jgi:hypothetical protein
MAYTIDELKAHLSTTGAMTKVFTKKEFEILPGLLDPSEIVHSITSAITNKGTGLLVATDKRLLFVSKHMFTTDTVDYMISKINSVSFEKKLLANNILISFSGEKLSFGTPDKETGQHFVDAVRGLIQNVAAGGTVQAPADDLATKLEKLANLRDRGILTEEEFQKEKSKLLN